MDEGKLLELFRQVVREELGEARAEVVSIEVAAKRLDVSEPTLRRMIRRGELLTVPVGRKPKVPVSEIRRIATPSASMTQLGQRRPPRQVVAKLKAESLGRKSRSLAEELERLGELRRNRKKR